MERLVRKDTEADKGRWGLLPRDLLPRDVRKHQQEPPLKVVWLLYFLSMHASHVGLLDVYEPISSLLGFSRVYASFCYICGMLLSGEWRDAINFLLSFFVRAQPPIDCITLVMYCPKLKGAGLYCGWSCEFSNT